VPAISDAISWYSEPPSATLSIARRGRSPEIGLPSATARRASRDLGLVLRGVGCPELRVRRGIVARWIDILAAGEQQRITARVVRVEHLGVAIRWIERGDPPAASSARR